MPDIKLKYYQDPGHGWVACKRKLLEDLGVINKITRFSRQRGATVYCEEDLDAVTLTEALTKRGFKVLLEHKHDNRTSPIRSYDNFTL